MCLIVLGGLGECVPGHQGVRGLTPLGPTLKIILGVMLMTWFLDPSSHWPLYYDLAFQTHVLSLDQHTSKQLNFTHPPIPMSMSVMLLSDLFGFRLSGWLWLLEGIHLHEHLLYGTMLQLHCDWKLDVVTGLHFQLFLSPG